MTRGYGYSNTLLYLLVPSIVTSFPFVSLRFPFSLAPSFFYFSNCYDISNLTARWNEPNPEIVFDAAFLVLGSRTKGGL